MEADRVRAVLADWFSAQGFSLEQGDAPAGVEGAAFIAEKDADRWYVSAQGDQAEPMAYLHAFEDGMAALVNAGRTSDEGPPVLGLALAFSSTENRREASYRRALKKYSNSIVFTDLNLHLLLVRDDGSVEDIPPDRANNFLRGLNRYILGE